MILSKTYIVLFLFVAIQCNLNAQNERQLLHKYFTDVSIVNSRSIPNNLFLPQNAKVILRELTPYLADTIKAVRAKAYVVLQAIGEGSTEASVRQESVMKLLQACTDKESGNVNLVLGYLQRFSKLDFTVEAKDTLTSLFRRRISHYNELIKLIGFLQIENLKEEIQALSQPSNPNKHERWAALLALARMNDKYAAEDILKRISKLPVNDEAVYQIYPDLIYTRQEETINFLITVLNSDSKNCESANAEHAEKIPCAYRIMEMLAPVIQNYPLKLDASGDVIAKDYAIALQTVRNWFNENKTYIILRDTY